MDRGSETVLTGQDCVGDPIALQKIPKKKPTWRGGLNQAR